MQMILSLLLKSLLPTVRAQFEPCHDWKLYHNKQVKDYHLTFYSGWQKKNPLNAMAIELSQHLREKKSS